nr:MAG TPA: hypothetical protein [Caudoviricetes sp.]DAS30791.1 MAG TPA: hypothetical protein [Caudoviricetes sp.]
MGKSYYLMNTPLSIQTEEIFLLCFKHISLT